MTRILSTILRKLKNISLFLLTFTPSDIFITQTVINISTLISSRKTKLLTNLGRQGLFFKIPAVLPNGVLWIWARVWPIIRYLHAAFVLAGVFVWGTVCKNTISLMSLQKKIITSSICLKLAYVLMVIAALACVFADFNGIVAGIFCCWRYFVVGYFLRKKLFCCWLEPKKRIIKYAEKN